MRITQAEPEFRPVTVVIETQDEWDQLMAILSDVAYNRINHLPQVMKAAKEWLVNLSEGVE